MTQEERIIMLSRARSMLEGKGNIRLSDVHDMIVKVIDDMVEENYERIAR